MPLLTDQLVAASHAIAKVASEGARRCVQDIPLAAAGEGMPLPLRAWRGKSGKRYVVSVYSLDEIEPDYAGALLLAVTRDGEGRRRVIEARESPDIALTGYNGRWIADMRRRGATELHVHLLARGREALRATLDDLAG